MSLLQTGVLSGLRSVLLCPFQITPLLVIDLATNKTSDQADHCKGYIGDRIYIFLYLILISVSCSYYFLLLLLYCELMNGNRDKRMKARTIHSPDSGLFYNYFEDDFSSFQRGLMLAFQLWDTLRTKGTQKQEQPRLRIRTPLSREAPTLRKECPGIRVT